MWVILFIGFLVLLWYMGSASEDTGFTGRKICDVHKWDYEAGFLKCTVCGKKPSVETRGDDGF